jgi:hypothetical protein
MAAGNPALAQMMARQLISKIAGAGGGPSAGGPPTGPGGPMPPPPGMMGAAGPGGPGAGGPGGPPGAAGPGAAGPGSPPTTPAGMQLSQQLSELQGADPDAIIKGLTGMKSMAVQFYTRAAFTMPGVTRNLAQVVKFLDNSIQEAEKAAATTSAAGPIANNAAIPNPAGQNGSGPVSGSNGQ